MEERRHAAAPSWTVSSLYGAAGASAPMSQRAPHRRHQPSQQHSSSPNGAMTGSTGLTFPLHGGHARRTRRPWQPPFRWHPEDLQTQFSSSRRTKRPSSPAMFSTSMAARARTEASPCHEDCGVPAALSPHFYRGRLDPQKRPPIVPFRQSANWPARRAVSAGQSCPA